MKTPRESLQILLYILARDHLPASTVAALVSEASHWAGPAGFPHLEHLASDLADRLIGKEEPEPEYRFGLFNDDGDPVTTATWPTVERAEVESGPFSHVRRGRIVERQTAFNDKIEWEDEPYGE